MRPPVHTALVVSQHCGTLLTGVPTAVQFAPSTAAWQPLSQLQHSPLESDSASGAHTACT